MSTAEWYIAQIINAVVKNGAAVLVIAVVEEAYSCATEYLNGSDVMSEMTRQRWQTIASVNAEVVAAVRSVCVKAGAAVGVWPLVPARLPVAVLRVINPRIVRGRRRS